MTPIFHSWVSSNLVWTDSKACHCVHKVVHIYCRCNMLPYVTTKSINVTINCNAKRHQFVKWIQMQQCIGPPTIVLSMSEMPCLPEFHLLWIQNLDDHLHCFLRKKKPIWPMPDSSSSTRVALLFVQEWELFTHDKRWSIHLIVKLHKTLEIPHLPQW